MGKDRDQLTPDEDGDRPKLRPRRSAAREAAGEGPTGPGPASAGADPAARAELGSPDADRYR